MPMVKVAHGAWPCAWWNAFWRRRWGTFFLKKRPVFGGKKNGVVTVVGLLSWLVS